MTKEEVLQKLNEINDPDIGIGIVDLGLIYKIDITGGKIDVTMTLTTPLCPLGGTFERQVKEKIPLSDAVKKVTVQFTFDPPWSMDRMTPDVKMKLGIYV